MNLFTDRTPLGERERESLSKTRNTFVTN